eukprot:686058-Pyramimonas_sp.AAC.2
MRGRRICGPVEWWSGLPRGRLSGCGIGPPGPGPPATEGIRRICRSSLDARKPQNPTTSEEHQGHLYGVLHST